MRRVHVTIVAVEKLEVLLILSESYPACKANAPFYFVISGPSGCILFFSHYLINYTILVKKKIIDPIHGHL
jgi:hypothetical protein